MADTFISYSRHDQEFVRRLVELLDARGKKCWVDWNDIPPTAAFMQEIYEGIEASDAFVFVISPDSACSKVCAAELAHAEEQHKRIIPVLRREPNGVPLPEAVASLNWLLFPESVDLEEAADRLVEVMGRDLEHVRRHTRWLGKALEWDRGERDSSLLLRGAELRAAEEWLEGAATCEPEPTPLQYAYVQASRAAAARRQRLALGALAFGLVVAIALAALAVVQRNHAVEASKVAESRLLASEAQSVMSENRLETGALLALAAYRVKSTPEARRSLSQAVEQGRNLLGLLGGGKPGTAVAFSPDGSRLAAGFADGTVLVWDARRERVVARRRMAGAVTAVALSTDAKRLAAADGGRPVVWLLGRGQRTVVPVPHTQSLAFSPRGSSLYAGTTDHGVVVWAPDHAPQTVLPLTDEVTSVAVSRDATIAAATNFGAEVAKGRHRPQVPGAVSQVTSLAFDPTSRSLGFVVRGQARLWDMRSRRSTPLTRGVQSIAFDPQGQVRTGRQDGKVSPGDFQVGPFPILGLAAGPGLLATAGGDGVAVWSTRERSLATKLPGIDDLVSLGANRAAIGYESQLRIKELDHGDPQPLSGAPAGLLRLTASPDGRVLAAGGVTSGRLALWSGRDFAHLTTIDPKRWKLDDFPASLATDGKALLEVTENTGRLDIWHLGSSVPPKVIRRLHLLAVAFTGPGAAVAVARDGTVYRVDIGRARVRRLGSLGEGLNSAVVSANGQFVAAVRARDGAGVIWRVGSGATSSVLGGGATLSYRIVGHPLAFDPSGDTIAAFDNGGGLYFWDVRDRQPLARTMELGEPISALAFDPTGRTLVVGLSGGRIVVVGKAMWTSSAAADWICRRIRRPLNAGEQASYHLPGGVPSDLCR
jgi:WD40 repeat protein